MTYPVYHYINDTELYENKKYTKHQPLIQIQLSKKKSNLIAKIPTKIRPGTAPVNLKNK